MNSKKISFTLAAGLALLLAGCGTQSTNNSHSSSSSSLIAAKTNDKISADNMSPQQAVAVITAYAGNKYGDDWATTAKKGQQDGLQVNLYRTDKYQLSDNGQGVAYNVTANGQSTGLVYTVKGNDVTIYQDAQSGAAKKLTTVSRADMVDYLNHNGQGQLVNNLAKDAKVVDKTNGGLTGPTTDTTGSSTHGQVGKYGNEGPVNVPSEMQGTWYTADNNTHGTLTFGSHTYKYSGPDDNGETQQLYKQDSSFLENEDNATNKAITQATMNWSRAIFVNAKGMHWLCTHGWLQTAGAGTYFAVHTETINGKQVKVLVEAGGADMHVDAVYYQTPEMAKLQADTKYDDLDYMD
ncbi:MAG TPA: hypothetical protein H9721_00600 [Candidatus Limosilactobacillus intestinipullorum]|nr:hypothetical protein [Candidatus Limosilactobacillus intestinipullorum]